MLTMQKMKTKKERRRKTLCMDGERNTQSSLYYKTQCRIFVYVWNAGIWVCVECRYSGVSAFALSLKKKNVLTTFEERDNS